MKVAQINMACGRGSTGRIVMQISHLLTEEGNCNKVFYSGYNECAEPEAEKINSLLGIRLHQMQSRFLGNQGWNSSLHTRMLVKKLKEFQPDIVHLHNLHGYYLNMKILFDYLAEADCKVIWTLHDCWAFTGHCAHYTKAACDKWKRGCSQCPQKSSYPYSLIFDRSKELFCRKQTLYASVRDLRITTVSKWLEDQVRQSALLGDREIRTIYNGVDTGVFRPLDKPVKNKKRILGVSNVWSERKGLQDFLKLGSLVSDDFEIVLVGVSEEQSKSIPKEIQTLRRTDSVEALVQLYNSADVFFNPSVEETFGLTTVEAMACGVPVVVYDSTASPELVSEGVGRVVPAGNVDAAYAAIQSIVVGSQDDYRKNCRKRVEENYDQKHNYYQYLELYRELIPRQTTTNT